MAKLKYSSIQNLAKQNKNTGDLLPTRDILFQYVHSCDKHIYHGIIKNSIVPDQASTETYRTSLLFGMATPAYKSEATMSWLTIFLRALLHLSEFSTFYWVDELLCFIKSPLNLV